MNSLAVSCVLAATVASNTKVTSASPRYLLAIYFLPASV